MRTLLLLRGSPGCGKSTWIALHGLQSYVLSADDIRMMCSGPVLNVDGKYEINQNNDKFVWSTLFRLLEQRMQNGEFTVIDATNSKTSEMNRYKDLCATYRYRIFCVDFTELPIEEAKRRNRERPELKRVPDEVIDKMYSRFATQKIPAGITVIKPDELDRIWMNKIDLSEYKKIHVIGDVHGCNTALRAYLGEIKDDEFYIFTGDYVDRGIENADVVSFLISVRDRRNVLMLEGNHECFHKNTEVLTTNGWKPIKDIDINKDLVAQFGVIDHKIQFVKPLEKIENYADELVSIEGFNIKQIVTPNHDVVYDGQKIKARDMLNRKDLAEEKFVLSGICDNCDYPIDDNALRFLVWVVSDGTIVDDRKYNPCSIKRRIQFKISREDKIRNLTGLLDSMQVKYTIRPVEKYQEGKIQPYYIRIYGDTARLYCDDILHGAKHYPLFFRNLSRRQTMIVLSELVKTDARWTSKYKIEWCCVDLQDVNIVQEMCVKNGVACSYATKDNSSGYNKHGVIFAVNIKPNGIFPNYNMSVGKVGYHDWVYCLTMPGGTLVTRIDGKPAFSGNCHLWHWGNSGVSASKEFELQTKTQLENAKIDKKDVRMLYRRFAQCAWFDYHGKEFLVTHGGLSRIPENITFVATRQMIHGVGSYADGDKVDESFMKNTADNCYQIHGHRNVRQSPVRVNERCFNLEGKVEFGGNLRCVDITPEEIIPREIPNPVFRQTEVKADADVAETAGSSVGDAILAMRNNKYIDEKRFGNISSFNFTRQAFYDRVWNDQTVKARGLYINIPEEKIVARSYDKFFSINERSDTKLEMLQHKLAFPVTAYVKENGFLGIVSYNDEDDSLFVTTKSNPEGACAVLLDNMLHRKLSGETLDAIKAYSKEHNISFVFECVDQAHDPHIIEYPESGVYLLDIIYNELEYRKVDFNELCGFADKYGIPHKERAYVIESWSEFYDWYYNVLGEDYKYNGRDIEGFVLEDANGYMLKLKLTYYNFWKFMRGIAHEVIRKGYIDPKRTSALTTPIANAFYGWMKELVARSEDKETIPSDILTLRRRFLESDAGKDFRD